MGVRLSRSVTVVVGVVAWGGLVAGGALAAVTPGWECIPTAAGQPVVSGGTGSAPSCSSGTAVLAPTYVSSGVGGRPTVRFAAVNFLNPERKVDEVEGGTALAWTSVTTGNLAGIDLWLDEAHAGSLGIETNVVSGTVELASLADQTIAFDGGGLGRQLSICRLPESDWSRSLKLDHTVQFPGGADLPVYLRVTQADGNQAWTSPIYLIA